MRQITRDELVALLDEDSIVIVEALPELHFAAEHLPSAVNLPDVLTEEQATHWAPDRGTTIVTYCSGFSCSRSKAAAIAFEKLGYTDVRVYSGGKADWYDAGLPMVSAAAA